MLEEKVGYTPQQLTYVVLLRQQLSNSKKTSEKLKREIGECRESLLSYQRCLINTIKMPGESIYINTNSTKNFFYTYVFYFWLKVAKVP